MGDLVGERGPAAGGGGRLSWMLDQRLAGGGEVAGRLGAEGDRAR